MDHSSLLVSPFFYPEDISTGKYNAHLAQAIVQTGRKIDVICSHPLYPEWTPKETKKEIDGIKTYRGGLKTWYPKNPVFRRLVLEIWFAWHVQSTLKNIDKQYSHVILIYPPNLAGALLGRKGALKNSKLVTIVHDLQGTLLSANTSLFRRFISGIVKKIEHTALKNSDKVIYLSNGMKKLAQSNYTDIDVETQVAYPFVSLPKTKATDTEATDTDFFNNNKTNVVYSGALGEKQNPDKLLELLTALSKDPRIQCHVFSSGAVFEKLKLQGNSTNIEFKPLVPEDKLTQMLQSSDLQIVPQVLDTSDAAFPSKVPNIIALNVPMLCITPTNSELHYLLEGSKRALICDHWKTNRLTNEITKFLFDKNRYGTSYEIETLKKFDVNFLIDSIF